MLGGNRRCRRHLAVRQRLHRTDGAEAKRAVVHAGREQLKAHAPGLVDQDYDLVGVLQIGRHRGRHELRRVVALEPGRLERHQRVSRAVRLVEGVAGKLLHGVEDLARELLVDPALGAPCDKLSAHLGHLLGLFLAHGTAQQVGLAQGKACQHLGDLHHLLLVQDDPVGAAQDLFHLGMRHSHGLPPVLAVYKVVYGAGLQRPRSKQRHECDDVFDSIGQLAPNQVLHAPGFQLEHASGLGAAQQGKGCRVVQRQRLDGECRRALGQGVVHRLHGPINDRQSLQAQEVELHQAGLLNVVLVELGNQPDPLIFTIQRHEVRQRRGRDDNAAGMAAHIPHNALELVGHVHDLDDFFALADEGPQLFAGLDRLGQCHAHLKRNQLRQLVRQAVGLALHARDVAHHSLRRHGAKGNDLADRVVAIAFGHMRDHAISPFHAEVDVEVGHRDAFRIQETLKQQVIIERVQIGNAQGKGNQGTGAAAPPGAYRDAVFLRPLNELHDDQKVAGKTHLADDIELEAQALIVGCLRVHERRGPRRQPGCKPLGRAVR